VYVDGMLSHFFTRVSPNWDILEVDATVIYFYQDVPISDILKISLLFVGECLGHPSLKSH
jgi:hypothetical protein